MSPDEIDRADWRRYLAAEQTIFDDVRAEVTAKLEVEDRIPANRYFEGSSVYPGNFAQDWNRSYVLEPDGAAAGAVVLLHGLTDAPYSQRHIAERYLVGFSNGGTLAMKYALDAIEDPQLSRPDRLVLISPMIGITAFARFAGFAGLPALLPAFAKAAWLANLPEFNPFKYNSFPVNGARQSWQLTRVLQRQIARQARSGSWSACRRSSPSSP
jgi:alpha-beta hydrolase superfamily lysophospholipase